MSRIRLTITAALVVAPLLGLAAQDQSRVLAPAMTLDTATLERMQAQGPLVAAADRLRELVDRTGSDDPTASGFGGVEIDVPARSVILYWKSGVRLPRRIDDLLVRLNSSSVHTELRASRFSTAELLQEADRLSVSADSTIAEVGLLPGSDGLYVEVDGPVDAVARRPEINTANAHLAQRSAEAGAATAGHVVIRSGSRKHLLTRFNDGPPWKGGAEIRTTTGACSSGFAAGSWFGSYMLSAAHCASWSDNVRIADGNNEPMGVTEGARTSTYADSMLIRLSASNQGRIYDGGVAVGEFTKPVKGTAGSYLNQYVCTSGAYSGARCDIKVVSTGVYITDWMGRRTGPLVKAEQVSGLNAAGEGDSGGPVFALNPQSNVLAAGIINAGDPVVAPAPCTGVIWDSRSGNRQCSRTIYYTDIWTLLNRHGVWLVTN